jgi:hypothetical protein
MCLYRDAPVVISSWSAARIPWLLCFHVGTRAFGKGLLVDEEPARAVRLELAVAVGHCWGVSRATVRKWRKVVGRGERITPKASG